MFDRSELNYLRARVTDLERQLEAERAENRRVERHWGDMFLRRLQTYPVPPPKPEVEKLVEPLPRSVSEDDIARADSVIEYCNSMGFGRDKMDEGIRDSTGWTLQQIEQARREVM